MKEEEKIFNKSEIRTLMDDVSKMEEYMRYIRSNPELHQLSITKEFEDEYIKQAKILAYKICDEFGIKRPDKEVDENE